MNFKFKVKVKLIIWKKHELGWFCDDSIIWTTSTHLLHGPQTPKLFFLKWGMTECGGKGWNLGTMKDECYRIDCEIMLIGSKC